MDFFQQHARGLFIFFIVPVTGLLLDFVLSYRKQVALAVVAGLFIVPAFIGYDFAYPRLGVFAEVLFLSAGYALVIRLVSGKIKIYGSVVLSVVLFAILGSAAVMNHEKEGVAVEQEWVAGHYRVDYLSDQTFDGGPLLLYSLNEYATIPFYLQHRETVAPPEDMSACEVRFPKTQVLFDRCHGKLMEWRK